MKRSLFCLAVPLFFMACGAEEGAGSIGTRSDALCYLAPVGTYRLRNNFTSDCIRATASGIFMATCNGADRNWTLLLFQGSCTGPGFYAAANGNGTMTSTGGTVVYGDGTSVDLWVPQGTNTFISFSGDSSCLHENASGILNFSTCGTNDRTRWTALPAY